MDESCDLGSRTVVECLPVPVSAVPLAMDDVSEVRQRPAVCAHRPRRDCGEDVLCLCELDPAFDRAVALERLLIAYVTCPQVFPQLKHPVDQSADCMGSEHRRGRLGPGVVLIF